MCKSNQKWKSATLAATQIAVEECKSCFSVFHKYALHTAFLCPLFTNACIYTNALIQIRKTNVRLNGDKVYFQHATQSLQAQNCCSRYTEKGNYFNYHVNHKLISQQLHLIKQA